MVSLKFKNTYILDSYTVAGPLEKKGQIKKYDEVMDDYYFKQKTFELAEIKMQQKVVDGLLFKNNLYYNDISMIIGGDLYNQIAITNTSNKNNDISFLGIYSACATFVEGLIIASKMLSMKNDNIIVITSSHNLNAEKQFRYPIEYGAVRKKINTYTATGAVSVLVTKKKTNISIESATVGSVVDKGIYDVNNMGGVMAQSCAEVIIKHLKDTNRDINYYDLILTGDLGKVGSNILYDYLKKNNIILKKHTDAGLNIFNKENFMLAGGSGPVCLPLVLFNKILKNNSYKKILIVGTGSLHTKSLVSQKLSIPSISHAVSLEVLD